MTNEKIKYEIGMIGLGVMGRNLALNIADHHYSVADYDLDKEKVALLHQDNHLIFTSTDLKEFLQSLKTPRTVMLLVPAGPAVDKIIAELIPHLEKNDLIIDAGNSHFTDTNRRIAYLSEKEIAFMGIGVSGGEVGARHGPSIMPGGRKEDYSRIKTILEDIAAHVEGEPCVTYLGKGSAGHYVKMVHNGIEYGIMQLIAETYDMMKRCLLFNNAQLSEVYQNWNASELNSYLIEITATIFKKMDNTVFLIDEIVDVAEQNGTGMWTSQSALELQMPTPGIDAAVTMRYMSALKKWRQEASAIYKRPIPLLKIDSSLFVHQLQQAYFISALIIYVQGFSLLARASESYSYGLDLENVASIWRGGCIIRAKILDDIRHAFHENKTLPHLLFDSRIAKLITEREEFLRQIVSHASHVGIAAPGFFSSLSYLDAMRSDWSPANLIQAQRDFFGSHQYERINMQGHFHTEWSIDT